MGLFSLLHHKKEAMWAVEQIAVGDGGGHGGITTWKEELDEAGEVGSLGQGVFLANFLFENRTAVWHV